MAKICQEVRQNPERINLKQTVPGFIKVKLLKMKIQKDRFERKRHHVTRNSAKAEARELEGCGAEGRRRASLPWATGQAVSFLGLGEGMTRKSRDAHPWGGCGPDQWQVCSLSWPGASCVGEASQAKDV